MLERQNTTVLVLITAQVEKDLFIELVIYLISIYTHTSCKYVYTHYSSTQEILPHEQDVEGGVKISTF